MSRTRDRHGRGPRGPRLPGPAGGAARTVVVPAWRSRPTAFAAVVEEAAALARARWPGLDGLEVQIAEAPPEGLADQPVALVTDAGVALAHAQPGPPLLLVVYRRPLLVRAGGAALPEAVLHVVLDALGQLSGEDPGQG